MHWLTALSRVEKELRSGAVLQVWFLRPSAVRLFAEATASRQVPPLPAVVRFMVVARGGSIMYTIIAFRFILYSGKIGHNVIKHWEFCTFGGGGLSYQKMTEYIFSQTLKN
jgi:uncharacterized membrane protein